MKTPKEKLKGSKKYTGLVLNHYLKEKSLIK